VQCSEGEREGKIERGERRGGMHERERCREERERGKKEKAGEERSGVEVWPECIAIFFLEIFS
jgi:hypothetical protein